MSHSGTSLSGQESSDQLYALNRSRGNSFEDSRFTGGASLSMDFSAPLTEQARAERIKQMSKNHVGLSLMSRCYSCVWQLLMNSTASF